jgi:hypothetical protein
MCRQLAAKMTAQQVDVRVAVPVDGLIALAAEDGVEQTLVRE